MGVLARAARKSDNRRPSCAVHVGLVTLLVYQTVFFVVAGAPITSSNPHPLTPTPAVTALTRLAGDSLVGLGSDQCIASTYLGTNQLGILPEVNVAFGVHELAIYDPLAPSSYYSAWRNLAGSEGGNPYYYQFCPAVTTVREAQRFGVGFTSWRTTHTGPFRDRVGRGHW